MLDTDDTGVWGPGVGGMVTIVHACVHTANIHNNCDNKYNQVLTRSISIHLVQMNTISIIISITQKMYLVCAGLRIANEAFVSGHYYLPFFNLSVKY